MSDNMSGNIKISGKKHGFTLMEVLVAVAITGLVVSAGFRLIAMSLKMMAELESERRLMSAAQIIWLRFRSERDMTDTGFDDENNIRWESEHDSIPIEEWELKYKKVRITLGDDNTRSTFIYVAD